MQRRVAMEWYHDPSGALRVDPMTALRPQPTNPDFSSSASASAAVKRGSLGMNFDCGGQDLVAQRLGSLLVG